MTGDKIKYYPIGVSADSVLLYNADPLGDEELNGFVVMLNDARFVDLCAYLIRPTNLQKVQSDLSNYIFSLNISWAVENNPIPETLLPTSIKPLPLIKSSKFMEDTLTDLNIPFASLSTTVVSADDSDQVIRY